MDNVPEKLISVYYEGSLDEAQSAELSRWVLASKDNALYLASLAKLEQGLVKHAKLQSNSNILAELQEAEAAAPIVLASLDDIPQALHFDRSDNLTKHEYASALSYVLKHTFTPKRVAILATAAALMLGVVLAIVMLTGPSDTDPIAETPNTLATPIEPARVGPDTPRAVATLTAAHNAKWGNTPAERALARGSSLYAGQRLTLTAGFAEITTSRGAVAILESPTTIELIDSSNALRLVTGKLVGICETESSKGLLIRTPHMDITDLGTRFGVDASQVDATVVHVFEGEVKIASADDHEEVSEQLLSAGQAIAARDEGGAFDPVEQDLERFAAIKQSQFVWLRTKSQIEGVRQIAGDLKGVSASQFIGKDEKQWPTSGDAFVFHDFVGRLRTDAKVNAVDPGQYKKLAIGSEAMVLAGTDLRSYVIYKSGNPTDTATQVTGSITFENEVIGIITDEATASLFGEAIQATSPVFTPGTGGQGWIDIHAFEEGFALSEDRRTLTFQFQVKKTTDMIRVLVKAE